MSQAAPPPGQLRAPHSSGFAPDPLWYKDAIVYEVHVRAFQDSSGDGIGDFRGLTARLDYLADLGVTAIWLLPFYPSPLRDDGYDIADYGNIHPDYGTMRDVRTFIREAHRRDLRVITELVFNHTSDQHPWFKRARKAPPGSVERDWYVWSDTPDRYRDARIIFKDFEPSNWSWDAVAGAYFWHRFYSHQPDLNFDQPRVREALLKATDFWLDAGVDGLRLDAIPYLYERDGTNCENLPETHGFLKTLRRHVDARYADRMLLAEANQWPEDSVAYFGEGDECHMAFHFPLMPRMFMALRMEDRFPILDILEQTPDLPESGQWALFLRNHDELTLEMVTDEERDYMYRVYAADPQARINLGIRRRLAPLLGNNRRRIELMNGLLFSLPGTPVIYYGDEIGMGDNVYVGDRNGVRTPMQWSSDRNAGFSSANRQRLYLPVVTDPEYHYEAVNVEAQQANPQSLLWWMKRIIALRKKHPAFGRGSLRFLHPANRRVLAFIREHEDETILVVANLSRYAQWTELALGPYEGRIPVELFGAVEFPRVGGEPYMVSLGPHSFLWFRLAADPTVVDAVAHSDLPELAWRGDLLARLKRPSDEVADVLLRWMVSRRWYRGGSHPVAGVRISDVVELPSSPPAVLALLQVSYRDTEPATYVLPLATDVDFDADELVASVPDAAIARLVGDGAAARLLDGTLVPGVYEALLGIVSGRRRIKGGRGDLVGQAHKGLRSQLAGIPAGQLRATPVREQPTMSNSAATYAERVVLKLYRVLEDGPNPDLEVGRHLAAAGFGNVPRVLGSVEVAQARSSGTLAMVQAYVQHEGNLWESMREAVGAFLHDAEAEAEGPELAQDGDRFFLHLSRASIPARAHERIGVALETARVLGERVGQMHRILAAADGSDGDFAPEPMSPFYVRSLYQSVRRRVNHALELLEDRRESLPLRDQEAARMVLEAAPRVDALLTRLRDSKIDGQRIRVHGDLHLGQVLDTGNDVVIIDFEGDTGRPLSERRLKRPALTDLASLIRSFHFAAHWPRVERELLSAEVVEADALAAWSTYWFQWMSAACVRGYRDATVGSGFNPADDDTWSVLFKCLLVSRACDELTSRLGSRSDWLGIPLAGLDELLGGTGEPDAQAARLRYDRSMCAAERADDDVDGAGEDELEFEAPSKGSAEELLDANAHDPLDPMRHSAAHIMAEAVLDLFPQARLGIGPAIKDGFYYDFDLPRPLVPEDLNAIEERMRQSVRSDHRFERREWDPDEGRAWLAAAGQTYKVEILDDLRAAADAAGEPPPAVTTYSHGRFTDLCRGPHVESTGRLGPFKLLKSSGAYWRGDEKRAMLQRIYGTVWSTQEELDLYLWRIEEARRRDHRRLGVALDLFSFHDVSPGSAFWHPKGQRLWRTLETAMRELQDRRGYQEVSTPILVHKKLWEQSGHWDHYDDNMFKLESEEQTFSLKPMNCPESTIIYKSKVRSYRDFPLRLSEYGRLHRNERSGTLSGLTRVRQFIQDDAHCYVRPDQLADEVEALLGEVSETFSWFGLVPRFSFATRPDKALGDLAQWEHAEALMRDALERAGVEYTVKPKDGTFYAPKIDIYVDDALGREWQMATIQADMMMLPERFDLSYIDQEGQPQRPIAIHRAIYGSFERFIGIITEHFAGAFPFWCAPVQCVVIPIADRHIEAAEELAGLLRAKRLYVEVDDSSNRMQNKIRMAQEQKVPYMLVLGDREVEARTASPRTRTGQQLEPVGWQELADRLAEEAAARRPE